MSPTKANVGATVRWPNLKPMFMDPLMESGRARQRTTVAREIPKTTPVGLRNRYNYGGHQVRKNRGKQSEVPGVTSVNVGVRRHTERAPLERGAKTQARCGERPVKDEPSGLPALTMGGHKHLNGAARED